RDARHASRGRDPQERLRQARGSRAASLPGQPLWSLLRLNLREESMDVSALLQQLGVEPARLPRGPLAVRSPIDGSLLAELSTDSADDVDAAIQRAQLAFRRLRVVPAPKRGELVRAFGAELRAHKALLAELVSIEAGKIRQEALGEVQEMIDICDFALGLSR